MANDWFEFKRFKVHQSEAAMKVGTDGTLLGAWARVDESQKHLLDIGTGTGLIALMLAQRTEEFGAHIDAIDIDEGAYKQAVQNIDSSPWSNRITIHHTGLRDFTPEQCYDHVISNPPYFTDSLESPDNSRTTARHTSSLSYEELTKHAAQLTRHEGLFSVIIPAESRERFTLSASLNGFALSRLTHIRTLPNATPKRVLLEFAKTAAVTAPQIDELIIESSPGGNYTDEYRVLTKEFYLKF